MTDVVDLVRRSLAEDTAEEFHGRVAAQAEAIREAIAAGRFDNEDFAVGLEVEVYAINKRPEPALEPEEVAEEGDGDDVAAEDVEDDLSAGGGGGSWDGSLEPPPAADAGDGNGGDGDERVVEVHEPYMDPDDWEGRLAELPESVFEGPAAKELGLHNAEINTEPNRYDATGIEVQTTSIEMRLKKAREAADAKNKDLVLDAMWTIPPEQGTTAYFGDVENRDGVVVARNMRQDPRYVAIENDALGHAGGDIEFSVPGADHVFPSILFESLATSVQPHLQIPSTSAFPDYYNAAIRTMGPLLALLVNSPFLPVDLYNDVDDPYSLLDETHHELRIAAFEQSVNTTPNPKVRVPEDIQSAGDVADRVVEDDTFAPFLREWLHDGERDGFADEHWEFDHKRGTYWRWLRCVVGGDPVEGAGDECSLRIEYRPLPTQPTPKDLIAAQTVTAGLVRGLAEDGHPIAELPWQEAKRSFYSAARDGLDADLAWVTADGHRTTDHDEIYDEVFEYARLGLEGADLGERRIDEFVAPLEDRWEAGETPASWKIDRVRDHLDDDLSFEAAVPEMQREYYELSREEQRFADWLEDDGESFTLEL